jgi:hypothetical protein
MAEASRQVHLRAEANVETAQLQVKTHTTYIKLESRDMREFMAQVRTKWPTTIDFSESWQKVINPVQTRYQQLLEDISCRSPYHAGARIILEQVVPYVNSVLVGQQLLLTCVKGVLQETQCY